MTDYLKILQDIENNNQKNKIEKAKLEERLRQLTEEKTKILEEMTKLGVTEANIDETIENLSHDISDAISECQEALK